MPELPQVNGQRLIRALRRKGWEVVRVRGSHQTLANPADPAKTIVVPVHRRDLRKGTLAAILKQAELTADELRDTL